jgi:hypothetical protein
MTPVERLRHFQEEFEAALTRYRRNPEEITVVAVSKKQPVDAIRGLYQQGWRHFGENQAQEGVPKTQALPDDIHWHFIGHIQKNKARRVVQHFQTLHSVDSFELLERLHRIALEERLTRRVFLQVNLLRTPGRYGFYPDDLDLVMDLREQYHHLNILGLMGMKPLEVAMSDRVFFQGLNELNQSLLSKFPDFPAQLSMGMSGDFEDALAAGSHFLRIGSALFGERS